MSVYAAGDDRSQDEAGEVIENYGDAAIAYMVQLIEDAVRKGDNDRVDKLDRLMREIEQRLADRS